MMYFSYAVSSEALNMRRDSPTAGSFMAMAAEHSEIGFFYRLRMTSWCAGVLWAAAPVFIHSRLPQSCVIS